MGILGESTTIILANGMKATVDAKDYPRLNKWAWHFHPDGYAIRTDCKGKRKTIRMHQELFERIPVGCEIDHIDGDGLNNRRENLRIVTHQQNIFNKKPHRNGTSAYKGVSYCTAKKTWRAQIMYNGVKYHLGFFLHEREAARAYDIGAIVLFGEHAWLNFPENTYAPKEINITKVHIERLNKKAAVDRYRGVWYESVTDKYIASMKYEGQRLYLGRFCTKDGAVQMHNKMASELCGVQVRINKGAYERVL